MAPLLGEHCENCLKHLPKGHVDGQKCAKCLADDGTLQRCNACHTVRYCTKSCQKEHWKTHKPICGLTVRYGQRAESAGVSERHKGLKAWVFKNVHKVALAGVTALGLHDNRERTETNVFVVYLDVVETPCTGARRKLKMDHSIRNALCVPLEKVHEMFAHRFTGGSATLERDLAPRPRVLRILIIDDGLPPPLDMFSSPMCLDEDVSRFRYLGPNWLAAFRRIVNADMGGMSL